MKESSLAGIDILTNSILENVETNDLYEFTLLKPDWKRIEYTHSSSTKHQVCVHLVISVQGFTDHQACLYNEKMLLFTGIGFYCYDIVKNKLFEARNLHASPKSLHRCAMLCIDGTVYLIGRIDQTAGASEDQSHFVCRASAKHLCVQEASDKKKIFYQS